MGNIDTETAPTHFRTSLGPHPLQTERLAVVELPLQATVSVTLAGSMGEEALIETVGTKLPAKPDYVQSPLGTVIWMTPRQFVISNGYQEESILLEQFLTHLNPTYARSTDISGAWVWFRITGPDALTLLAAICQIDVTSPPKVFHTRCLDLPAMLLRDGNDAFLLIVDSSVGSWVADRLIQLQRDIT